MRTTAQRSASFLFFDEPQAARRRRVLPALGGLLVFLVVLACAARALARGIASVPDIRLEEPGSAQIKAKHMEAHGDEYDLVFVGSSRVFRQIKPGPFEARLEQHGLRLETYNLGLPGVRFYEVVRAVEELMDAKPARLCYLVIELMEPDPPVLLENLYARKEIAWHTPRLTSLAVRRVLRSDRSPAQKEREIRAHLLQLSCAYLNVGTGRAVGAALLGTEEVGEDLSGAGYVPLGGEDTIDRRREFLDEVDADRELLQRRAEELRAEPRRAVPDDLLRRTLAHLVERTRSGGVEPIFVVLPPLDTRLPEVVGAHEEGVLPNLLHYADPDAHPDFYLDFRELFDKNHLDRDAATRFTQLLADDFAEVVRANEED